MVVRGIEIKSGMFSAEKQQKRGRKICLRRIIKLSVRAWGGEGAFPGREKNAKRGEKSLTRI